MVPTRYSIELSIDPSKDTFSGKVVIDITLKEAQDAIWLHGKNLKVSEVYLTDADSNRIDATYEERQESGVALVTLPETPLPGQRSSISPTARHSTPPPMRCSRSRATAITTPPRSSRR